MEARHLNTNGFRAEEESGGDLPVREALGEQREHVELPRRRLVPMGLPRARRLGRDACAPCEIVSEGPQRSRAER
jgi:hypothetical protein